MHLKICLLRNKILSKFGLACIVGLIQIIICYFTYYLIVHLYVHVHGYLKCDISWGIGITYWAYLQTVIGVASNFVFLLTQKRRVRQLVSIIQVVVFMVFWYGATHSYPYRVLLLFCINLLWISTGYVLLHGICKKIHR
ncbi:MAG: hypothetical protein LBL33_08245 [Tannerella sp.]|jgi:hypothetical protein|nr:hypothetical protein [Tannerella sp.]